MTELKRPHVSIKRAAVFQAIGIYLFVTLMGTTCQVYSQAVSDSTAKPILRFQAPIEPSRYLIYPGQQLTVTFLQSSLSPLQLEVNSEGAVVHPSFGKVEVGGEAVSLAALRSKLLNHLKTFFKMQEIEISVSRPLETTIEIVGEVASPGSYRLSNALTLSHLIDSAGGVLPRGSQRTISVLGVDSQVCDLLSAEILSLRKQNPYLYGVRRVIVPVSGPRVRIEGDVIRPADIEFHVNETLESLFPFVGGLIGKKVISVSQSEKSTQLPHTLTLESAGQRFVVHTEEGRVVSLQGAMRQPQKGMYAEQSLQQAIAASGGFVSTADSSRVVVWRRMMSSVDQRQLRYPLLITREFYASATLLAGDSVVVPVRRRFVEVVDGDRAQAIPYQKIMSVRELLQLVGKKTVSELTHDMTIRDGATELELPATLSSLVFDGDRLLIHKKENRP